ncbi:MAG: Lactate utilization protein C [Verrucomicrobiae bacterium]|nr:Lactate utilization protein C [Verrucomicrobiae bacterium]
MNAAREQILARVRAALRVPAPRPAAPTTAPVFPPVTDLEKRFREEFTALRGEIVETLDGYPDVTGCDCLVAQTGSIIVSTRSAGGRVASVLPEVHAVRARRDQIVADLPAALALLRRRYDGHWPSALSVITGPSRTADIEKILVMGAHGPKRLLLQFVA